MASRAAGQDIHVAIGGGTQYRYFRASQGPWQGRGRSKMKTVSLANHRLFYFALALTVAPFWLVSYLPMVDLPQHAGQVAALRELLDGNQMFVEEFEVNWFTPYLLAYVLLFGLSFLLPLPLAAKVLVTAAVVAIPLLTGRLLRELDADPRLRWLAIPGAVSFAFYWGFLSFLCAAPVGMLLILQAIRFERAPTPTRAVMLAATSVLLFFSHILVLGVSALAGVAYLAGRNYRRPLRLIGLALPLAVALPLIVVWLVSTMQGEAYVQEAPVQYGALLARIIQMCIQPTGIDKFWPIPSMSIAMVLYLSPLLLGCRITRDPARWLLFLSVSAVFFSFPAYAFRTGFLYERFGVFLLPFWLLLWDRGEIRRVWADALPMLTITAVACFNILRFSAFNVETRDFDRVVSAIEDGSRVASVVHIKTSAQFAYPVYFHQAVWYQAIGKGIVDFNFGFFYPQLVRFRPGRQTGVDEQFAWFAFNKDWVSFDGDTYDYFIFHADQDLGEALFREHSASVPLVANSGYWWLYKNERPAVLSPD